MLLVIYENSAGEESCVKDELYFSRSVAEISVNSAVVRSFDTAVSADPETPADRDAQRQRGIDLAKKLFDEMVEVVKASGSDPMSNNSGDRIIDFRPVLQANRQEKGGDPQ